VGTCCHRGVAREGARVRLVIQPRAQVLLPRDDAHAAGMLKLVQAGFVSQ
jgi:hypothetical protein